MSALFGLLTALSFGVADTIAATVSRREDTPSAAVLALWANIAYLLVVPVALAMGPRGPVSATDALLAATSGFAGVAGLILLFRGLGTGAIGVVLPIRAVLSGILPIAIFVALGERPQVLAWVGIGLAILAGTLSSGIKPGADPPSAAVRDATLAGLCFGVAIAAFAIAAETAGVWALAILAVARTSGTAVVAGLLHRPDGLQGLLLTRSSTRRAVASGSLGATGDVTLILGVQAGSAAVTTAASGLAPAAGAVLAWFLFRERLNHVQLAGLALSCTALGLLAFG